MLTRVEIDNFKSFEGFSIDLPAFCVVVGPNASGKSNLFDALRLLSRLADVDFAEAAKDVRGRPHEMFRQHATGHSSLIKLAVEVLLDRTIVDSYAREHKLKNTRIRYEVSLELRRDEPGSLERVYVVHEAAEPIRREGDRLLRRTPRAKQDTLKKWAVNQGARATSPWPSEMVRRRSRFGRTARADVAELRRWASRLGHIYPRWAVPTRPCICSRCGRS